MPHSFRYLALVLLLGAGCAPAPHPPPNNKEPPQIDTRFERLPRLLPSIQQADAVSIYEGLPSVFSEPELRQQELQAKPVSWIRRYPFYNEPHALEPVDSAPLRALLATAESYRPLEKQKSCPGFHSDFAAVWKTGAAATQVLINLECGEVKIFSPQGELHCDLGPPALSRLKELLRPYAKRHPLPDSSP